MENKNIIKCENCFHYSKSGWCAKFIHRATETDFCSWAKEKPDTMKYDKMLYGVFENQIN